MPCVLDCPILLHQEVAEGHFRIGVRAPAIAEAARPGQFAMVQTSQGYHPFLRRPMSFERIFPDGLSFLMKVEGEGTGLLARLQQGQVISVQGPLGNGFTVDPRCSRHIIVAGGIGVAPFPALAEAIKRDTGRAPEVVLAARTDDLLLCDDDLRAMGCMLHIATDDGSAGRKGLATDVLLGLEPTPETQVYACGPNPMLKAVSLLMMERGVPCQVSLEAQMACGDGACLGCVIEARVEHEGEKMLRVCADGPVFDCRAIDWPAHNLVLDR